MAARKNPVLACAFYRTSHDGNIYRVIFCLEGATMVLLHAFQKKSRATPKADLALARQRRKEAE